MVTLALVLVAVAAVAMLADTTPAHSLPLFEALPNEVEQTTRRRPAR